MFSYKGLESKLAERGIGRSDLTKLIGISSRTVAKIGKGEKLSRTVMDKLAAFFECDTLVKFLFPQFCMPDLQHFL